MAYIGFHNLETRDDYLSLPIDEWEWEELMAWLVDEGCYSCAMDYLTPEEAKEEVILQMEAIGWKQPQSNGS